MTCEFEIQSEEANIIQGEDRVLTCRLVDKKGAPFSLASATEITARFPGSAATVEKKLTTSGVAVVSEAAGKITITLTDTDTSAMVAALGQSFEVWVDYGTTRRKAKFEKILNVRKST